MGILKSGGKLHWIKNLYQRWRYGAGCCDLHSLDYYLAKKILPTLKEFRKKIVSYPANMTAEEWEAALDEMIWAFDYFVNGEDWNTIEESKTLGDREQNGFELFGKHFRDLWR